jgi:hypothetical protein
VDIRAPSEYLGHHDPGFTLRTYVHLVPSAHDRMRQAIDATFDDHGTTTAREAGEGGDDLGVYQSIQMWFRESGDPPGDLPDPF